MGKFGNGQSNLLPKRRQLIATHLIGLFRVVILRLSRYSQMKTCLPAVRGASPGTAQWCLVWHRYCDLFIIRMVGTCCAVGATSADHTYIYLILHSYFNWTGFESD